MRSPVRNAPLSRCSRTQCTCQWSPGHGEPYQAATRCEQDAFYETELEREPFGDEFEVY